MYDRYESWVGAICSKDGVNFDGAPELVLPSTWPQARATHNLAVLQHNGTVYFVGGRDRGCVKAPTVPSTGAPLPASSCQPTDVREHGIWMARGPSWRYHAANGSTNEIGLAGAWFPKRFARQMASSAVPVEWSSARRVIDGHHPGCIERRDAVRMPWISAGVCEFDGRLALVQFARSFWLYTRANFGAHGMRWVQVVRSRDGDDWNRAPFEPIQIANLTPAHGVDIYYFAAQANPVHDSMLAVFPLVHNGRGCICLSFSRDGVHWSAPQPLVRCTSVRERTTSHPAPGLLRKGAYIWLYMHENVPDVHVDATTPYWHKLAAERMHRHPPRVLRYSFFERDLLRWTINGICALPDAAHDCAATEAKTAKLLTAFCPSPEPPVYNVSRYDRARMHGAAARFTGASTRWLRGLQPTVLALEDTRVIDIGFASMSRPRFSFNSVCESGNIVPRAFNPSLIVAPALLCPGCAYVLSVRADSLHQCDASGASSNGFLGSAIAVLDAKLRVLTWSWLRWTTVDGVDEGIAPFWDVRLLSIPSHHQIFASYSCSKCTGDVRIAEVHLNVNGSTSDDGVPTVRLAAWVVRKRALLMSREPWQSGRNQVGWLYVPEKVMPVRIVHKDGISRWHHSHRALRPVLMIQPVLQTVASFGTAPLSGAWRRLSKKDARLALQSEHDQRLYAIRPGQLTLVHNDTARLAPLLDTGHRLSPTTHLLPVRHIARQCAVYLGVGHMHRGSADPDQDAWTAAQYGYGPRPNRTFRWGHSYTTFLYALERTPPFRIVATSGEFCLASLQDSADCESIQFVSGLAPFTRPPGGAAQQESQAFEPADLVLTMGVNDCEARMGMLSTKRAFELLRPIGGAGEGPCFELA